MSYLGDGRMAVAPDLPALPGLDRYEHVVLSPAESYAANCVRINDRVLVPARHPRFADELARLGYQPLPLEMSEFQKMDGGLSCLSLRF
jgi:dimethylargininase